VDSEKDGGEGEVEKCERESYVFDGHWRFHNNSIVSLLLNVVVGVVRAGERDSVALADFIVGSQHGRLPTHVPVWSFKFQWVHAQWWSGFLIYLLHTLSYLGGKKHPPPLQKKNSQPRTNGMSYSNTGVMKNEIKPQTCLKKEPPQLESGEWH
jgi:hypothetical protein